MEPEGVLLCSQELTTAEPDELDLNSEFMFDW
jgi:hypothetical protein